MSKVTVAENAKSKLVFTPSTKPSPDGKSRGFFIVESTNTTMEGGFINTNRRTATLTVETSIGEALGWVKGTPLNGKIIVQESHTPFYHGQDCKINPTSKAEILVGGKRVYRQTVYTDNLTATDGFISNVVNSEVAEPANRIAEQKLN